MATRFHPSYRKWLVDCATKSVPLQVETVFCVRRHCESYVQSTFTREAAGVLIMLAREVARFSASQEIVSRPSLVRLPSMSYANVCGALGMKALPAWFVTMSGLAPF